MTNHPWDRQRLDNKCETSLWYGRFSSFRLMGPTRSLLECVNRHRDEIGQKRSNNVPGSWRQSAEKWSWRDRAESWDQFNRDRIESEFQTECDQWRTRRFEGAAQLWDTAKKMLDTFPIAEREVKETKDGKTITTIIKPISGVLSEIARVWKEADAMARTTTRETLPKTELEIKDWRAIAKEHGIDPDKLYSDVIERLASDDERSDDGSN